MNPLQLVLAFYQLAQKKAKKYADSVAEGAEKAANKIKSLEGWTIGKKPDAYPTADAVVAAMNKLKPGSAAVSVSGRTLSITIEEEP